MNGGDVLMELLKIDLIAATANCCLPQSNILNCYYGFHITIFLFNFADEGISHSVD